MIVITTNKMEIDDNSAISRRYEITMNEQKRRSSSARKREDQLSEHMEALSQFQVRARNLM